MVNKVATKNNPTPEKVKVSDFGCKNCLWCSIECKSGSMYKPCGQVYDEPECENYTYYD